MTDKPLALQADRELDALIAERIMGWHRRIYAGRFYWFGPYDGRLHPRMDYTGARIGEEGPLAFAEQSDAERFSPSTDIAAAWQVVEKLLDQVSGFECGAVYLPFRWRAEFGPNGQYIGEAETAPLAICRAALAALGTIKP